MKCLFSPFLFLSQPDWIRLAGTLHWLHTKIRCWFDFSLTALMHRRLLHIDAFLVSGSVSLHILPKVVCEEWNVEPVQSSTSWRRGKRWTRAIGPEVKSWLYTILALQLEASPFASLRHSFLVYQGDMYISFLTTFRDLRENKIMMGKHLTCLQSSTQGLM